MSDISYLLERITFEGIVNKYQLSYHFLLVYILSKVVYSGVLMGQNNYLSHLRLFYFSSSRPSTKTFLIFGLILVPKVSEKFLNLMKKIALKTMQNTWI